MNTSRVTLLRLFALSLAIAQPVSELAALSPTEWRSIVDELPRGPIASTAGLIAFMGQRRCDAGLVQLGRPLWGSGAALSVAHVAKVVAGGAARSAGASDRATARAGLVDFCRGLLLMVRASMVSSFRRLSPRQSTIEPVRWLRIAFVRRLRTAVASDSWRRRIRRP